MHKAHPLRIFAISGIITLLIGAFVGYELGLAALWLFTVLAIMEVTFSFDNAVINSRILVRMSPLWQTLFLTIGIFIAVFVVRFALPIFVVMGLVAALLYVTVEDKLKETVLISSLLGITLQFGLSTRATLFDKKMKTSGTTHQVGWAAFASFMYLEVLDASFSFDGVIGAFAITTNIVLIVAGLGVGAFWVRSLTVYLMRAGTLAKYRYLEHGAHWAILALGCVMLVKLYHVSPPEWVTGSLWLVFIVTAIISSVIEKRRLAKTTIDK